MGRFVDTQEANFVNNYVQSYLSASSDYSVFQEGSPTFCEYYSVDKRKSTTNIGLGNVVNIVGSDSPIKYNKIENFALYGAGEIIPNLEYDEQSGNDTIMEGEALVLPDTIVPSPEDLFIISYQKDEQLKEVVYEVNNVEVSSYSNKTFYKISFSSIPTCREEIEDRQLNEVYKLVYNNIGTGYNAVVSLKDYLVLEESEFIYENLLKYYVKYFFDRKLNSFIYDFARTHSVMKEPFLLEKYPIIYDPKLALFIKHNNLFIKQKTLLKNIYIDELLLDREYDYEFTIFNLLEHPDEKKLFKYDSMYCIPINESVFAEFPIKYYECVHNITNFGKYEVSFNYKKIFNINIKEYLNNYSNLKNIPEIDNIEKLLVIFLKEFDKLDNYKFLEIIKEINVKRDFHSYLLIPCVLFIINKIQEKIFRKDSAE